MLQQLAHGGPVSGAELAAQLASHAPPSEVIEACAPQGCPSRHAHQGYCLPPDGAAGRRAHPAGPAQPSRPRASTWALADSTQMRWRACRATPPRSVRVVLAETQTGKVMRAWVGVPGQGWNLSCLKRPGRARQPGGPVHCRRVRVQALAEAGAGPNSKWPNDVLAHRRWLAFPIEVQGEYDGPLHCAWVGGTCGCHRNGVPRWVSLSRTWPRFGGGRPPERNVLAARLIDHLCTGLITFEMVRLCSSCRIPGSAGCTGNSLTLTGAGICTRAWARDRCPWRAARGTRGQVHTIQEQPCAAPAPVGRRLTPRCPQVKPRCPSAPARRITLTGIDPAHLVGSSRTASGLIVNSRSQTAALMRRGHGHEHDLVERRRGNTVDDARRQDVEGAMAASIMAAMDFSVMPG